MSADNGIYILETEGPEYRVRHLQAIENLNYDRENKVDTNSSRVMIENARRMWRNCKVFTDRDKALREADRQAGEILNDPICPILEYGICSIKIDEKF